MTDITLRGRDFRITKETITGECGFTLREWDCGRDILHDFGLASEVDALALAARIVED